MALPIAPTPVLYGKDARRFLAEVKRNEKKPAKLSPIPDFQEIRRIVLEKVGKKHD
jgi:hypothetical protein